MTDKATPNSPVVERALKNMQAATNSNAVQMGEGEPARVGRYTKLPKPIVQFENLSCWAAATEAWLDVIPSKQNLTQEQLISWYATNSGNGALEPECKDPNQDPEEKCFGNFAAEVGIEFQDMIIHEIRPAFLIQKLAKGPVIVIFNLSQAVGNFFSHAIVVYGVGRPEGQDLEVSFMDPANGSYENLSVEKFHRLIAGAGATRRRERPFWINFDSDGKVIALQARVGFAA